jgi:lipid II:glycine glycyltransferase (peptidoglycan interpeptide bridge formation enzyme)
MDDQEFQLEVDQATATTWAEALDGFADASVYQTWAFGAVRWGERNLSHLLLRRDGDIVAMAQVALAGPRKLGIGIAYLRWGPLWQRKGREQEPRILDRMAAALHAEYAKRRGLFLRILPNAYAGTPRGDDFRSAFARYGSEEFKSGDSYRTLIVDLTPSLRDLRTALDQKWRNQLNRAEKNQLAIREGGSERDFAAYIAMHEEMLARKRFAGSSDVREFARMQAMLPLGQRMKVMLCEHEGAPVAGLVGTCMGDWGIYLFGATTERGLKTKGAYLLQWRMIEWLKAQGARGYDLGGINPETNPGVYHFKAGLAGRDVLYVPPLVSCDSRASELFVGAAEHARRRLRGAIRRLQRS